MESVWRDDRERERERERAGEKWAEGEPSRALQELQMILNFILRGLFHQSVLKRRRRCHKTDATWATGIQISSPCYINLVIFPMIFLSMKLKAFND